MKKRLIYTAVIGILGGGIFGCTAIHRVEIPPLETIERIDETKMSNFLIDHGFRKNEWEHRKIFGAAARSNQDLLEYWATTYYHEGRKRGGAHLFIVTEPVNNIVIYIVGDSNDIFDQTKSFTEEFIISLPSLYPGANISYNKRYFFDFR